MNGEAKHYSLDQLCDEKRTLFDELPETAVNSYTGYQGRSLAFKIRRNAFPAGAPPGTRWGSLRRSPDL